MQKATRQFTKQHNIQLVLKTIYQQDSISRADLARVTGLTRTTVSEIVHTLIEENLVQEVGRGESLGGKPPVLLSLNKNARLIMCLDLSQRRFTGALMNLRGEMVYDVPAGGIPFTGQDAYQRVLEVLDELKSHSTVPILGIGIGSPGLVDVDQGVILKALRLQWSNFPLKSKLEQVYSLPVHIVNAGHIAAIAEYTFGDWADVPNLVVLKSGEGVGSGILLDGKLHFGDRFIAGEIGHIQVADNHILCECGQEGCLETEAGSIVLLRRASSLAEKDNSWLPVGVTIPQITMEHIRLAYLAGNLPITEMVNRSACAIGIALSYITNILDIRQVVLAGDMVRFGEGFSDTISQELNQRFLLNTNSKTKVGLSTLGEHHVLFGATALVLSRELGLP
ncbi:MAG: sugar kinase [Anaerolineaceae bacterium]|nr:sugar kinase [Anaerolineaceae bacterium]